MANPEDILGDLPFSEREGDNAEPMDDRRTVRTIRTFMSKSKDYRQDYLDLVQRSHRIWQNWETESRSKIKRANMQPSYGFMIIETLLPQMVDLFFGDNAVIKFRGREAVDAQFEDCLTDFFDIQFEEMDLRPKWAHLSKNILLDGTGFAKVPYRFQEQLVARRKFVPDEATGQVSVSRDISREVIFDGPDFEVVAFFDFFPDWRIREPGNVQKMRGCAHRMWRSLSELKALEKKTDKDGQKTGIYNKIDELKRSMKSKGGDAWGSPYWDDQAKRQLDEYGGDVKHIKESDLVELWEYWGLHDIHNDGNPVECIVTIANGDTVIREQENFYDYKFKPFIAIPNYIRPNEFYGLSELQAVEAEIREAKAIRNARLDQINLSINTMWLVDRTAGIDAKNLYSRPGGIVYANDINGVKPMPVGDPSLSSAQEMQNIESQISQITAMGAPPVVGSTKSFARSATGVNFVQQFASSRLGLKAKLMADCGFKPMIHIMMMTNRQFVTDDQWVRRSDPNCPNPFEQLPQDAFFNNYDYIVDTKADESDEQRYQKIQSVAQIAQVAEQTQPGAIKMDVLLEALLRPLLGSETKHFMRSPEEMQQLQQQKMVQQLQMQAANAQIGAMAPQPNSKSGQAGGPLPGSPGGQM